MNLYEFVNVTIIHRQHCHIVNSIQATWLVHDVPSTPDAPNRHQYDKGSTSSPTWGGLPRPRPWGFAHALSGSSPRPRQVQANSNWCSKPEADSDRQWRLRAGSFFAKEKVPKRHTAPWNWHSPKNAWWLEDYPFWVPAFFQGIS